MWCRSRLEPARFCTTRPSAASVLIGWLAVCCLAPQPAAADGIAPGEWKLTETIVMNGSKAPAQTRTRCLSPEQAGDTFDTPKHYSATIASKGAMAGREVVNTTVSIEGEHVGECR